MVFLFLRLVFCKFLLANETLFFFRGGIQLSSTIAKNEKTTRTCKDDCFSGSSSYPEGLAWMSHFRSCVRLGLKTSGTSLTLSATSTTTSGDTVPGTPRHTSACFLPLEHPPRRIVCENCRRTLPETNCSHLKIGRAPKGNNRIPTHPFSGANC